MQCEVQNLVCDLLLRLLLRLGRLLLLRLLRLLGCRDSLENSVLDVQGNIIVLQQCLKIFLGGVSVAHTHLQHKG